MQGELLTRCLLHLHSILYLHVIEAGGDLLTLRSLGRAFGIDMFTHSVVGVGGFGWPREPRGEETRRRKGKHIARVEGESSANRGCLQVSTSGKCDGLLGQNEGRKALLNLSFTSNLNPLGLER